MSELTTTGGSMVSPSELPRTRSSRPWGVVVPDASGVPTYLSVPVSVADRMNLDGGRFWRARYNAESDVLEITEGDARDPEARLLTSGPNASARLFCPEALRQAASVTPLEQRRFPVTWSHELQGYVARIRDYDDSLGGSGVMAPTDVPMPVPPPRPKSRVSTQKVVLHEALRRIALEGGITVTGPDDALIDYCFSSREQFEQFVAYRIAAQGKTLTPEAAAEQARKLAGDL